MATHTRSNAVSLLAAACFVLLGMRSSTAATIYVDDDAVPGGDGSSWATAFDDLQDALAVAVSGDQVWVAEGTYLPSASADAKASFVLVDGVHLLGGFAGGEGHPDDRPSIVLPTVLSGDLGTVRTESVILGVDLLEGVVLDRLTIRDGYGPCCQADDDGAGGGLRLLNSRVVLRDCVLSRNFSEGSAGGIFASGGKLNGERVLFDWNSSNRFAGQVMLVGVDAEFVDCQFVGGQAATSGGAIYAIRGSALRVERTLFNGNRGDDFGGGIVMSGGTLDLISCEFTNQTTWLNGAALLAYGCRIEIHDCVFRANAAISKVFEYPEGGVVNLQGCSVLMANTTMWDNFSLWGGALLIGGGDFTAINSAFVSNGAYYGGMLSVGGSARVDFVNSIVWDNDALVRDPVITVQDQPLVRFDHCIVQSSNGSGARWSTPLGVDLGGNLDLDPRFVVAPDASGPALPADLHLLLSSPALESGTDPTPYLPAGFALAADLDGNPRISGNRIDIGAYEYQFDGCPTAQVEIGPSWDGIALQEVFDARYGVGAIDAATDYSGTVCGDPIQAYWLDSDVDAWLVREIASNGNANVFGWHAEDFASPVIDGVDDGVIFTGPIGEGASASVTFPSAQRFGFYLDPNGPGDATNAPHPEHFFTNRLHNDAGPDGSGAPHQPFGGDVQCLIYDVSHLRGGVPTYVLAWEDLDAGSPPTATYTPTTTDNDFNDLVVEIRAESPVPAVVAQLRAQARDRVVELQWELQGTDEQVQYEIQRRPGIGAFETIALSTQPQWTDDTLTRPGRYEYRIAARFDTGSVYSQVTSVDFAPGIGLRSALLRAVPNPFNPATRIEYVLAERMTVTLRIFDLAGREVRRLDAGEQPAGLGAVQWDGTDARGSSVASGAYLVRLDGGGVSDQLRVVLVK